MESNDSVKEGEVLPEKTAFNLILKRDFPFFDEREDAILVRRLNSDELVWSPKSAWRLTDKVSDALHQPVQPAVEELFKVRIRDKDRFWTCKVTEKELHAIQRKDLVFFWNSGWPHRDPERQAEKALIIEWRGVAETGRKGTLQKMQEAGASFKEIRKAEKTFKKRFQRAQKQNNTIEHREWCLVTRKQRELLLNHIDYDDHPDLLLRDGGSSAWAEWSSIRWLKSQKWRNYTRIKRTPVLSLKK